MKTRIKDGYLGFVALVLFMTAVLMTWLMYAWLSYKGIDQRIHDVLVESEQLMFDKKTDLALKVVSDELQNFKDKPIDSLWLPVVRLEKDGFVKLEYFYRVIEHSPNQEEIYKEVGLFLETMPDDIKNEVKSTFAQSLKDIKGIRYEWVEKYNIDER